MKKTNPTKPLCQIADEYGIHRNTLSRKLNKKGVSLPRGLLYPADVKRIYKALGDPKKVPKAEDEE